MGGVLMTVFETIAPKAYMMVLILLAVGFFGVYVPWNEKKRKNGGQKPAKGSAAPVGRGQALVAMGLCVFLFTVGIPIGTAGAVMGHQLVALVGWGLVLFALWGMLRAGRAFRSGQQSQTKTAPVGKTQARPTPLGSSLDLRSNDRPGSPRAAQRSQPRAAEGHDHIKSTELSHSRKLEQLKALKDAGLLTQEEYDERRKKISGAL